MPEIQTLSERETEILLLIASGKSNKEIALDLQISANTVKVHVRNIFGKLEVSSRTEASMVAIREGLIDAGPLLDDSPDEEQELDDPKVDEAGIDPLPEGDAPLADPLPDLPDPLPNPRLAQMQTWFIAGFIVIVVLLSAIAIRLYNPASEPTPSASVESVEQVAVESRWEDQPNLPNPRTRAAGVSLNDQLYVIAGSTTNGPSSDLLRFDSAAGTWTALSAKPTPVSEVQAAVLGGKIYVPGGLLPDGSASRALEIYNPQTDEWEAGPDLPGPISAYALTAHEGKLYIFGGWTGESYTDRTYLYNPDTQTWSELSPLPEPLGYAGAAVASGRIYLIGGFDGNQASRSTFVYTPSQEDDTPWRTAAEMPGGRYAMGLVSIADKIHVIGGQGGEGRYFSQMEFSPQTNLWQVLENPLAGEWAHPATVALGTEIFAFGGEIDGVPTDRSLSYQVLFIVIIPVNR